MRDPDRRVAFTKLGAELRASEHVLALDHELPAAYTAGGGFGTEMLDVRLAATTEAAAGVL